VYSTAYSKWRYVMSLCHVDLSLQIYRRITTSFWLYKWV